MFYSLVILFFVSFSLFASVSVLTVCHSFSFLSPFSLPVSPPLLFLCSFYFSTVCIPPRFVCRLLAVRFLFLPAPPSPPLPPLGALRLSFFSSGLSPLPFFASFPILHFWLLCWFSLSLSRARVLPSRVFFSVIGNAVQGCLSVQFDLVCCLLFLSSGFVFYVTERGGGVSYVVRFL